jgi:SNF2 family DNA or RNA helicase
MDALEIRLTEMEIGFVRIDGSTPTNARHAIVKQFQDDEQVNDQHVHNLRTQVHVVRTD